MPDEPQTNPAPVPPPPTAPTASPPPPAPPTPAPEPTPSTPPEPVPAAPVAREAAPAPAPTTITPPSTGSPQVSPELQSEIDEAMASLGLDKPRKHGREQITPIGGPAKPAIHPRVVQAGREHRSGLVVSVGPTDVFVEFGPKELGVVDRKQFKDNLPNSGDELEVVVDRYEREESIFICSLPGAVTKADWEVLQPGQTVEARVTGTNKGGLELEVAQHRAFMPASQVALEHIDDLSVFVGEKMTCVVQRIDRRGSGNIVLSRRDVLAEERKARADELKNTLEVGQTREGTVRKIMPFGAFVDLGGIDGLVHISDLAHGAQGHGEKVVGRYVKEGDNVSVQILKLDWENNRIGLGMKQLEEDPFAKVATEITDGADIPGRVVRLTEFGAFIEVAPGVEGLAHISELEHRRINHPSDVLKVDEVVQCRVLKVDPESRRVSLSLKALKEAPKQAPRAGGRGRGRGDRDDRTPEEIKKETPELRRLREKAKMAEKKGKSGQGGLGEGAGLGLSLGDLKL